MTPFPARTRANASESRIERYDLAGDGAVSMIMSSVSILTERRNFGAPSITRAANLMRRSPRVANSANGSGERLAIPLRTLRMSHMWMGAARALELLVLIAAGEVISKVK